MTEQDDLRAIFRTVAEGAQQRPTAEDKLLVAARRRRLMAAGAATLSLLVLIGGIAGASILWEPDRDRPAPPAHGQCVEPTYDVALFLLDSTTADELDEMREALLADADVEEATFVSKAAAFQELKARYEDQPELWGRLPEDAPPSFFRVRLVEDADPDRVAARFEALSNVRDVRTADAVADQLAEGAGDRPQGCPEKPDPASMTVTELAAALFLGDALIDAVPPGFSVDQIVRNDPEETNHDYATVGVQMSGRVEYARVIFFVHPDEEAAAEMAEKRSEGALEEWRFTRRRGKDALRPFSIPDALPGTTCAPVYDQLLSCHAVLGRVMVLTQSTAGAGGADATSEEMEAATTLIRSFGSYLQRVYPESEQVTRPTFARYFFEGTKENMSASGVVEVDSVEGTLCLQGTFSENIVASHLLWRQRNPADEGPPIQSMIAVTFFDPEDDEVGASLPAGSTICLQEEQLGVLSGEFEGEDLQALVEHPERFRIDFHRGPNDDPGLVAELQHSPDDPEERRFGDGEDFVGQSEDTVEAQGGTIRLKVIPESIRNGKVTKILLVNESEAPIGYGYDTTLQRDVADDWRPVRRGNRCVSIAILLLLQPGEETDESVGPVDRDCGVLPLAPGNYRVTKDVELESGDRLPLTVTFSVAPPADQSALRRLVTAFMQARVDGAGAERFLDRGTWTGAGPPGTSLPLYPDPRPEDFRIEFIDDLDDGTYEVGVSLIFEGRTSGETLFVRERDGGLLIVGARGGLKGP